MLATVRTDAAKIGNEIHMIGTVTTNGHRTSALGGMPKLCFGRRIHHDAIPVTLSQHRSRRIMPDSHDWRLNGDGRKLHRLLPKG